MITNYPIANPNSDLPRLLGVVWDENNTTTITREVLEKIVGKPVPEVPAPQVSILHDIDSLRLIRIDQTLDVLLTALKEALAEITRLNNTGDSGSAQ